jgi:hypothetical protein
MPPFCIGVLARTLPLAEAEAVRRRDNARRLIDAMRGTALVVPTAPDGALSGFLRLPVLLPEHWAFALGAGRSLGIMPTYPSSLADLKGFGEKRLLPYSAVEGARLLVRRLVTLPTHSGLAEADLRALEAWIRGVR